MNSSSSSLWTFPFSVSSIVIIVMAWPGGVCQVSSLLLRKGTINGWVPGHNGTPSSAALCKPLCRAYGHTDAAWPFPTPLAVRTLRGAKSMPVGRHYSASFFHQEVVENETHGTGLRSLRQKLTGDAPFVVGRARQINPAGKCDPDCRCNQGCTLPAMGVGGAGTGSEFRRCRARVAVTNSAGAVRARLNLTQHLNHKGYELV